jgi:hypothetical protein
MIEIQQFLRAADSDAALEHIQRHGTPAEVAARYKSLVLDLYWKAHDLPAVVIISRGGIAYCLGQSLVAANSPELAGELRRAAKSLAYDAGSFTWPGWQEPLIRPTPEDIAFGRDCAQLNLRLAIELKTPPLALSKAHWLMGAHALAARDFDLAAKEFQCGLDVLPATDAAAKAMQLCNAGYLSIARLCMNPTDAAAMASFADTIARLAAEKNEDAEEYSSQLASMRRYFVPSG